MRHGEECAGHAHEGAAKNDGLEADGHDAHARRIGGARIFADHAQIEAPGRAVQDEGHDRHGDHDDIGEGELIE